MSLLTIGEAAERLDVSPRQVQYLVAQGHLVQVARGVLAEASLDHFLAVRGTRAHTRAWAEPTAWAAIAILSDRSSEWMGGSQRSRLKARLRSMPSADLVERVRNRAEVVRYTGHPAGVEKVRDEIIDTSRAATALGLVAKGTVDGYVAYRDRDGLLARHGLIRDDEGQFTLRATSMDLTVVRDLSEHGVLLAALDLSGSLDSRERGAGRAALDRALRLL